MPALTSVRVDYAEFGEAAARALLAAIGGEPAPEYSPSAPELVVRASTARRGRVAAAMAIGILTGSGTYALPGFDEHRAAAGLHAVGRGARLARQWAGVEVLHISRHGAGHPRLSNHVTHRANIAALKALGATGVLAVTVCGAVDPSVELGSLVCFDDLHFLSNRLPDGSLCTFFTEPGAPERGHWIYEGPFSSDLRAALLGGRRGGGRRRARRRLLRPRRRAALQHARRDPRARGRAASPRCRRRPGRRPCCAARPSCRTRCSAS